MTKEAMEAHPESALWKVAPTLEEVNGKTAYDGMRMGDPVACEVVDTYQNYLGAGLTNFVNIFQPEVLLIGGGICKEGETLLAPLREYIAKEAYSIEGQLTVQLWRGPLTKEFSEILSETAFPLSQEGLDQLTAWLGQQAGELNQA